MTIKKKSQGRDKKAIFDEEEDKENSWKAHMLTDDEQGGSRKKVQTQ